MSSEQEERASESASPTAAVDRVSAGVRASLTEYLYGCPICNATDLRHYCRVPSLFNAGEFVHYERCTGCGTVIRNPRLPPDYRIARYEDIVLPDRYRRLRPKNQVHYAYTLRDLDRRYPKDVPRRLLDFGCGSGGFLLEARKVGFEVMGLELNRDLAHHVETTHDIPVFRGLIDAPDFAAERFNFIVSSQVFEHLLDPRTTLADLEAHLAPPGYLLIEVPNLRALKERLRRGSTMDDAHLFYFTARSLTAMLRQAGFRILSVREGMRLYRFLRRYDPRLPQSIIHGVERLCSLAQIKTGLSVLARLA